MARIEISITSRTGESGFLVNSPRSEIHIELTDGSVEENLQMLKIAEIAVNSITKGE